MKKLFLSLLLVTFSLSVFSQGITFEENHKLADALAKAKTENKLVFIDAYAVWCGPCKMMAKDIFPQKEVGDYFNAHFVNLKLDMEAPENVEIAKKYQVKAYPTYLFLNPEGELVHQSLGSMPAANFIDVAKMATDPENNFLAVSNKIKNGDRSAETIKKYLSLNPYGEGNSELIENYFQSVPEEELYTKENWDLFDQFVSDINSESFRYFLQNRDKIADMIGKDKVDNKITSILGNAYYKDPSKEESLKKVDPVLFERVKTQIELSKAYGNFYKNKEDKNAWNEFVKKLTPYANQATNPDELNNYAWMVFQNYKKFNDVNVLKSALGWAKKAVEAAPDKDHIMDTYANLLFANGMKKEALQMETKALEMVTKAGAKDRIEQYTKAIAEFKK